MNQGFLYGQLVIGPAGSGKSTYCHIIQDMAITLKRNVLVINLDPAAEDFKYNCALDIRDLITLQDVMEELQLGPNGGLVYCMEYLIENFEWFQEQINSLQMDDYVLIDCPGQIELYTHLDLMNKIVNTLQQLGFSLCSVYMLDTTFLSDNYKFISGVMMALSAQINLSLPHITVMTKCDLVQNKKLIKTYLKFAENMDNMQFKNEVDKFQSMESGVLEDKQQLKLSKFDEKYLALSQEFREIIASFNLIQITMLDINKEDTIRNLIADADQAIQYGENLEPDEKVYSAVEKEMQGEYDQEQDSINEEK